jgi:hypothetical protein
MRYPSGGRRGSRQVPQLDLTAHVAIHLTESALDLAAPHSPAPHQPRQMGHVVVPGQPKSEQEFRRQEARVIAHHAIHLDPITRPEIAEMDA